MSTGKYAGYADDALKPFAEKLLNEYYSSVEVLCNNAKGQAEKVNSLETETTASEYAQLCCNIIDDLGQHVEGRKKRFIPYVHELVERTVDNHDCSSCTGNCKLGHEMQVTELNESNNLAKKILHRLQLASLPLYSQTMFPDEYRILRNRMALMEMNMTELFFLENTYLIPKIIAAQKKINAGHS